MASSTEIKPPSSPWRARMRRTTRFRQLIDQPEILVMPGAHDALSVRLIEMAGFEAFTAGGYAATASLLGAPDIGQLGLAEMADHYARLCDVTPLPVLADADTGYGSHRNDRLVTGAELAKTTGETGHFLGFLDAFHEFSRLFSRFEVPWLFRSFFRE